MKLVGKSLTYDFFRFIIPSLIAQWVFALYTMVDGMFVAKGVSEIALSAVNISMPFTTLLFSIALLFSVGSSTVIAILLGQKQYEEANKVFTQNIITAIIVSILLTLFVLWKNTEIAYFLGATELTLDYVRTYITTIACFSIFFICSYSLEVLIKTDGYPTLATIIVIVGAVLNCILDYIFVMVLHKGVFGAAFATGISQLSVTLLYLIHFCSKRATIKARRFHFQPALLWRTIKIGLSSGITEFSAGIVIFLFNHAILTYINEEAIVSYTIISYISTLVVMSIAGVAQGIQPLVSYHYGAGSLKSCKKLLSSAMLFSSIFSLLSFAVTRALAVPLVNIFISSEWSDLRIYSVTVFKTFSYSFLILWINVVIGGYFTAIERPKSAMAISLGRGFVFVALSLSLLTSIYGGSGIWFAATLSEMMCLLLTIGLFIQYSRS